MYQDTLSIIIVTLIQSITTLALGFWLGMVWLRMAAKTQAPTPTKPSDDERERNKQRERDEQREHEQREHDQRVENAQALLAEVNKVADGVTGDIGQHTICLEEINGQLTASQAAGTSSQDVDKAVQQLLSGNRDLNRRLNEAKRQINAQAELLKQESAKTKTDYLTGIANRRCFEHHLAENLDTYEKMGTPVSVVMLDCDSFRTFNESHGHSAGDAILQGIARVASSTLRKNDLAARFGGDEFAFLLPGTRLKDAQDVVERVREAVEAARFEVGDLLLKGTISLGVAEARKSEDEASLLARADEALYASKRNGKNSAYLHDGSKCQPVQKNKTAAKPDTNSDSERASERRRFSLSRRIARYAAGTFPKPSEFFDVQCRDLSPEGITLFSPQEPDWDEVVVEQSTDADVAYFVAKRVWATPLGKDASAGFSVKCEFVWRLTPGAPEDAALADDQGSVASVPTLADLTTCIGPELSLSATPANCQ